MINEGEIDQKDLIVNHNVTGEDLATPRRVSALTTEPIELAPRVGFIKKPLFLPFKKEDSLGKKLVESNHSLDEGTFIVSPRREWASGRSLSLTREQDVAIKKITKSPRRDPALTTEPTELAPREDSGGCSSSSVKPLEANDLISPKIGEVKEERMKSISMICKGGASNCEIHRCRHHRGFICAEKRFVRGLSTQEEEKEFLKEIEMMKKLPKHSNLVRFMGSSVSDTHLRLYLSLCDGSLRNLIDTVKSKKLQARQTKKCCCVESKQFLLTPSLAKKICLYIAQGVECLHANGILHLDLKSDNIMLTYSGTKLDETPSKLGAKPVQFNACEIHDLPGIFGSYYQEDDVSEVMIGDFGVSLLTETYINHRKKKYKRKDSLLYLTQDNAGSIGTPGYMAPEVLQAHINRAYRYNEKADVFSFGMTVYEVVTLKRPFEEYQKTFEINALIEKGHIPYMSEKTKLSYPRLYEIFVACTNFNPEKRPTMTQVISLLNSDRALALGTKPGILASGEISKSVLEKEEMDKSLAETDSELVKIKEMTESAGNYPLRCSSSEGNISFAGLDFRQPSYQSAFKKYKPKDCTSRSRSVSPPPVPESCGTS